MWAWIETTGGQAPAVLKDADGGYAGDSTFSLPGGGERRGEVFFRLALCVEQEVLQAAMHHQPRDSQVLEMTRRQRRIRGSLMDDKKLPEGDFMGISQNVCVRDVECPQIAGYSFLGLEN
eukprot:1138208-Pelagomonas_calceolata.AAC.5